MSIQASLVVVNQTGETLKVVAVSKVNDDAKFGGIEPGQVFEEGTLGQLFMSNNSFGLAPQGVGAQVTLVDLTVSRYVTVYLEIPASGSATFEARDAKGIVMTTEIPGYGLPYKAVLQKE